MAKPVVLFLCTENIARSQMAEGLLRKYAGSAMDIRSAGLHPGQLVHPLAVQVMNEIGLDISGQAPKAVKELLGKVPVSHAIFVCSDAEERCPRLWPTVSRLYWPTDNPAGASGNEDEQLDAFRRARDELHGRIKNWLMDLSESGKVPTSYSL